MSTRVALKQSAAQDHEWHDRIRRQTAVELRPSLDRMVAECCAYIQESMPELDVDEELAEGLYQSTYDNLERIFDMLAEGQDVGGTTAPPGAIRYAETMVRRGTPLASLLRAYRLGTMWTWTLWRREIITRIDDPDLLMEAVDHSMSFVFDYVDAVSEQVTEEYAKQRETWARSAAALRHETVEQVLAGEPLDLDVVAARLGYDLRADHVAFILTTRAADDAEDVVARLETQGQALAGRLGARRTLLVPDGRTRLWMWCTFDECPSDEVVAEVSADRTLLDGIVVTTGMKGAGREGFTTSHEEALHVKELLRVGGRHQGHLVRYEKVAVASLLASDLPRARRFIAQELGDLAAGDDATRRVRATVTVLLEESGRATVAAKRLGIHQNTVSYRVRQAERLLGHPLSERRYEVETALRLLRAIDA
ncbi:helix-turn-helix domain-containing protein [Paraconexibacter antarcticus]|uniref:Helix-turn-helix domain-containing protein n=1 Tax=Paraconexibacter antarcticus TaxID=2949664 RepID=A0ABY5DME6_9ACTN|nr:helix-turn-helix domain-containing protein [Paraconexibacter antarcticus]UTI63156.1 helix-turn-helix domain-containing protein [Paraconexibacter antarcticus]